MQRTEKKRISTFSAILIVGLAMYFLLYKYLLQIFPTVMTSQLRQHYHLSGFGLGNLAACFFYSYFVIQIIAGPILDKYSLKLVSAISICIAAIGALLFAAASSIELAVSGRILMGVGAAFATVSYLKMTASYFKAENFAFIGGLLTVGVMLGALFGQAPMAYLSKNFGWQHSIYAVAAIGFAIATGYLFYPKPQQIIPIEQRPKLLTSLLTILKQKNNWYLLCYSGLAFAPLAVFGGLWGTPFLTTAEHISTVHAGALISLVYVGFGIGGPVFGYLAKKINIYNCMYLGLIISIITVCYFIYMPQHYATLDIILLVLFGFATGAFMLGFAVGKNINPPLLAATVVAVINTGDAFLGAVTEPFIGKLLDINSIPNFSGPSVFNLHDYHIALLILPAYIIIAAIFLRLIQRNYK